MVAGFQRWELDSGGANSRSQWSVLRFMLGTGISVIFTKFFMPKASHRPAQIQAEGTVQGVDTGKSGLLGPPRDTPSQESTIFLKGKRKKGDFPSHLTSLFVL